MKVLLDTCTFLWIITADQKLSSGAKDCFSDPDHEIYLSTVSVWEMTVKHTLGALELQESPHHLIPKYRKLHKIESLPLHEEDTFQLSRLPSIHKDPFDRMLICQAISQGLTILTPDPIIEKYPVSILW